MKNMLKVYLAGGFNSGWQDKVREELKNKVIFFDPRFHGLEESASQYTTWDLFHVKNCDILFAFMEATNPSGYGLSLEVGYAKALGKTIILIDEKSLKEKPFDRYFKIVRESSDSVFDTLNDGIKFLKAFQM
jgi:nucleoside 2-deoxyribosyltransferase